MVKGQCGHDAFGDHQEFSTSIKDPGAVALSAWASSLIPSAIGYLGGLLELAAQALLKALGAMADLARGAVRATCAG